ncbi:hypothetical protein cyc_06282 [Cyclospora cayetanensis]|uniref:Uncharacterized protein n=1 Tax=Cyclospora cayetanensis TaxID=88456 RepID=A0A1D3CRG8_9EIME|nr:hypothetical protein cyc_06282 [Cyclospora cayetanensis]
MLVCFPLNQSAGIEDSTLLAELPQKYLVDCNSRGQAIEMIRHIHAVEVWKIIASCVSKVFQSRSERAKRPDGRKGAHQNLAAEELPSVTDSFSQMLWFVADHWRESMISSTSGGFWLSVQSS